MSRSFCWAALVVLLNVVAARAQSAPGDGVDRNAPSAQFEWTELAALPDDQRFGGGFLGVSDGALIFAGGTNFPDALPRQAGTQVWYDSIFVLEKPDGQWKEIDQRLPRPLAYGVSVTQEETPQGAGRVIAIGGHDGTQVYDTVVSLQWRDDQLVIEQLPALPQPCSNACGGLIRDKVFGDHVYVAGGVDRLPGAAVQALKTFWVLSLDDLDAGWQELEPWPGAERTEAVSAVLDGKFYIVSGKRIVADPAEPSGTTFEVLTDGYRYTPDQPAGSGQWERIAELPRGAAAAASPAPAIGQQHFLIVGGDDRHAAEQAERGAAELAAHPGFVTECLAYHAITDTWTPMGMFPDEQTDRVSAPTVRWEDEWVIAGGESRPGEQSPKFFTVQVKHRVAGLGLLNLSILVLYLSALVGMGVYFATRERSTDDYFLGGRRIPWWAAGLSIFGTTLSSISFMAVPAKVYATDWLYYSIIVAELVVPVIVALFYMPFFRRLNVTSAYEYLERRFNVLARLVGSASFILFQTGRMTIVLFLPALALSAVTGINIYVCIIAIGLLATVYTVLGGIEVVIWTDVLQVVVLLGGALVSLVIISFRVDGGFVGIVELAHDDDKLRWVQWGWDYTLPVLWVIIVGGIFQNLVTYSADQAVIQRYLTTKDEKATAHALYLNAAMAVPGSLLFFSLGTALYAFYKTQPQHLSPALVIDQTFPLFIAQQLPPGVMGLVIAAIFAASMSTVDSSLNSISTAVTTDFFRRFRPQADDRTCLNIARLLTVIFGAMATCAALWMAAYQEHIQSLWDVYIAVLGLLMGSLAGVFALGMFTRRASGAGALVGMVAGAVGLFCIQQYTKTHGFLYAGVGIVICFAVGYLASRVLPSQAKDLEGLTIHTPRPGDG
jgi:SSS family transporter